MTDYGRGSGSEAWHPEDPLFGDVYDQGQGYQQQQHHPQQGGWQDPYATGQQQVQYPQQGYPQDQYPQQQYPQDQYSQQQYQQRPAAPQQPQQPQSYGGQQGYDPYDTGSYSTGGYGHQDPYGGQQAHDPYGGAQQQPDFYGQNGYPPPQQPQFRGRPQQGAPGMNPGQPGQPGQPGMPGAMGQPGQPGGGPGAGGPQGLRQPAEPGTRPLRTAPEKTGEWGDDDESDPREHAFFAGGDDDDEDDDLLPSSGRRAGKTGGKEGRKRRSGCACLVVATLLVGGVGGAGYFGYNFYQSHFGPAPDYSGQGTGDVQVSIPSGSSLTAMGNILKTAGVVKSVGAFTAAAGKNPKGTTIQAGTYLLHKQMAASAAVTMMLDPKAQSAIIIPEGMRDKQIYALIDQKLALPAGSTQKAAAAKWKTFGLPSWANSASHIKDPLEGFLFPSKYSAAKGMQPEAVLRQMVGQANTQYSKIDMVAEAKKQGLKNPLQLLTVASLVQAEGKTDDDFRKMAKVVYNRRVLGNPETAGFLQFDSTYNYIKNTNATDISTSKVNSLDDPYNTYKYKGLPPGPIGNPGLSALQAAMNPDDGKWWYFISLDGKTTQFTETHAEFNKLYAQYNKKH